MFKVLIIDDDIFVHSNLKKLIDWEKEGFILCRAAINATEAIQIIAEENPEIIFTDMSMPGLSGVEIIKYLLLNHPQTKVIGLSAYDDFEYVKESMKLGAVDYILKHTLTPELLLNLLQSVKQTIIREIREGERSQKIEEQIQTGKSVLQQNFIRMLVLEGNHNKIEVAAQIEALDLELGLENLVVVTGEIDDYPVLSEKYSVIELENLMKSFNEMSAEILRDMGQSVISLLEEGRFVIIFSFEDISSQSIYNQVFTSLSRIKTTIKRYLNITACFAMVGICKDITDINNYFLKAERLLSKKFYEGKDRIFHDPSVEAMHHDFHVLDIGAEKQLLHLVKSGERDRVKTYLKEIFDKIQQYQPDLKSAKITFITLLNIINKIARDYSIQMTFIYGDEDDPYQQLDKFETVREIGAWFLKLYDNLIDSIELLCVNPEYDEITNKAIEFIRKNFRDEISLTDIANYIGVNSSYLSRKFKKDCGKGVIEFLNSFRIEQAKLLMENGRKKVKAIANEVGFYNYNYFFKVFKDSQGMTPLEYEKSCR